MGSEGNMRGTGGGDVGLGGRRGGLDKDAGRL